MKKIFIISSPFFGYQESAGRAFAQLGYEVKIETYDEPIHPFRGLLKWKHKFAANKEILKAKSRKKYDIYIRKIYNTYLPDIVFIYNGTMLLNETLDFFRLKSKVIIWMYDSVLRSDRLICKSHIDHVDAMFCFEYKDVEYYKSVNKTAYFLPLACDPDIYHTSNQNQIKDIDILFAGYIYGNKKRIDILEFLVKHYNNLSFQIYGMYKPYYKNPVKWLFRTKRKIYKNKNISPEKLNELYRRCKIALNIHHVQTIFGANPRVFEICSAGAYQICDANPFIENIFSNKEVGLYRNEDELINLIDDAIQNHKIENAKKAQQIVLSEHTFIHRIREMLKIINE
jgi:spore maturation protein CgeB